MWEGTVVLYLIASINGEGLRICGRRLERRGGGRVQARVVVLGINKDCLRAIVKHILQHGLDENLNRVASLTYLAAKGAIS